MLSTKIQIVEENSSKCVMCFVTCYFAISLFQQFVNLKILYAWYASLSLKNNTYKIGSVTYGFWNILNKNIDDLIQIIGVNTEYKLVEIIMVVSVFFHISDIVYSHIFLSC